MSKGVSSATNRHHSSQVKVTSTSSSNNFSNNHYCDEKHASSKYKKYKPLALSYFVYVLLLILVVFCSVIVVEKQLPTPLKEIDIPTHPDRFIAERAYRSLKRLTDIGPRIAGSYENEVLAVQVLKDEIETIMKHANREKHIIELDVQRVSGAFNLAFLDGMTNVYRGLQNVVVKVGSALQSPHSLLINCHFDSVMDSPGGSDDVSGCAVMLEILRVISKSPNILRHNIIFLFNGGEENFLPASHGFITQHKWAKEVRAFINLEACGAGGREVLFQAGPNHPWILETYSEEVPYPYASSLAQEIFQSGIIPGDTDYRIFRDFGNLSGLDFAWSANGYVYHTKHDSIEQVPLGSLQRTGDNILALSLGMAQGHQLANVEHFRAGNLVFFDFLGAFVVRWSMFASDVINIGSIIFSLYTLWCNMKVAERYDDVKSSVYWRKLTGCVLVTIGSWLLCVAVTLCVALFLTGVGRTMSWFARPLWVFFLYVIPTMLVTMAVILIHANRYHKDLELSPWTLFQLYYDAYQVIWTIVLFVGVISRIRSSFIALVWVFSAALGSFLKNIWFGYWRDARRWLLLHICVMGLPFVQCFYLIVGALYLFIPITGRAGADSHAELLIAILVTALFMYQLSFVIPLVLLVKDRAGKVFNLLAGMFLLAIGVLILTPMGFPYSGEKGSLAPQRFMIAHTLRTLHSPNGSVSHRGSGYWIVDMDINSPFTVVRQVPEMRFAKLVDEECQQVLYCGMPYLVPVLTMIRRTHWLPGPEPRMPVAAKLRMLERRRIAVGLRRYTMKIEGPTHMGIMISPLLGIELMSTNVTGSHDHYPLAGPKFQGRDSYFIYYAYGLQPEPFTFAIDFKVPDSHRGPIMDIALTAHILFGKDKMTPEFKAFVNKFPHWAAVTTWSSTFESWVL